MAKVFLFIALLFIAGGFFYFFSSYKPSEQSTPKPAMESGKQEIKASFAIFTNSTFRIFTDPKYYNQSKDIYMEEANIVTVKKEGATWNDFFKTLPMKLTRDCLTTGTGQMFCTQGTQELRFFINGDEDANALDKEIEEGDKLLVSFGNKSEEEIEMELQRIPSN